MTPSRWVKTYQGLPFRTLDNSSFEIEHAGDVWAGHREVRDGRLYVTSQFGSADVDVDPYRFDLIAKATMMLRQIIDEMLGCDGHENRRRL